MTRNPPSTVLQSPTSRCLAGVGRVDVTPPVGIYHRMWGAAQHDCAEGIHRPLTATALVIGPPEGSRDDLDLLVAIDHCLLRPPDMEELLRATAVHTGVAHERIAFSFSHTHSGGHLCRTRSELPGGDRVGPYLDALPARIADAHRAAVAALEPIVVTYATHSASCDLGQNRDFAWVPVESSAAPAYLCGLNPEALAALPVAVARFCDSAGRIVATVVNYSCHPTTLAWDNRLISPDYVGSLRETVERVAGGVCLFFLAPSGDVGPKFGFVGDPSVADRNGRQLGYAALSALESMSPPAHDYHFVGAVLSGATIGAWEHRPHEESRRRQTGRFRRRSWSVALPYRDDLPTVEEARTALEHHLQSESAARARGNPKEAADARALAERERRLLERIEPLPAGGSYPFPLTVWQQGDAFWIAIEGEPYLALKEELERRFPRTPLVFLVLANGIRSSYLPRRIDYDKPLYEVEVSLLAPGALETLTEEISVQIAAWVAE